MKPVTNYLLSAWKKHDCSQILGLFSTLEKAEEHKAEREIAEEDFWRYEIEEWEIDKPLPIEICPVICDEDDPTNVWSHYFIRDADEDGAICTCGKCSISNGQRVIYIYEF